MPISEISYIEYDHEVMTRLHSLLGDIMAMAESTDVADDAAEAQGLVQQLVGSRIREASLAKELAATSEADKSVPSDDDGSLERWEASATARYDRDGNNPRWGIKS